MDSKEALLSLRAGVLCLLLLAGCDGGSLAGVQLQVTLEPTAFDFGRAREGEAVERTVWIRNDSRTSLLLELKADAPFQTQPTVELAAAEAKQVTVTFVAGEGVSSGSLTVQFDDRLSAVTLNGLGVRPTACVPSAPCRVAEFSLEEERCKEHVAEEGAECQPLGLCVEAGVCRRGDCVGTLRSCDDRDVCTADGCSATLGCINEPVRCPPPSNPCLVAACNSSTGCFERTAPDGTHCGKFDCVETWACDHGVCKSKPTADGELCAPPLWCQGAGFCSGQRCVRPDAGELHSDYSASLEPVLEADAPAPVLRAVGQRLYVGSCGHDGGCRLSAYSSSGFLLHTAMADADDTWRLLSVSDAGALIATPGGVEQLAPNATRLYRAEWGSLDAGLQLAGPEAYAEAPDGRLHVLLSSTEEPRSRLIRIGDAGELTEVPSPDASFTSLAFDSEGALMLWGPEAGIWWQASDGGEALGVAPDDGGEIAAGLAVGPGVALLGGKQLWRLDGGELSAQELGPDAGGGLGLLTKDAALVISERCDAALSGPCPAEASWLELRAHALVDGTLLWSVPLTPVGGRGELIDTVVAAADVPAVASVVNSAIDGGVVAGDRSGHVLLHAEGEQLAACALERKGPLVGGLFHDGRLYVIRADGLRRLLEAYALPGLTPATTGWPSRDGAGGRRRAGP